MAEQLLDFGGKEVLVVGGSSGIGNAIAQAFRRQDANVHVWGTRAGAESYVDEPGSDFNGLRYRGVDVTSDDEVARGAETLPCLDVLILSQGIVRYRKREFDIVEFDEVIAVNLVSMMRCAVAFKDKLVTRRGSVIVIGSTAMFRSTMGNPGYSASKAGLVGLTRSLGDAWVREGVRVNAVAPGMVATKLTGATTGNPDRLSRMVERIPSGRLAAATEIAGAALFLASPLASYVVGEVIIVDGGLTLG